MCQFFSFHHHLFLLASLVFNQQEAILTRLALGLLLPPLVASTPLGQWCWSSDHCCLLQSCEALSWRAKPRRIMLGLCGCVRAHMHVSVLGWGWAWNKGETKERTMKRKSGNKMYKVQNDRYGYLFVLKFQKENQRWAQGSEGNNNGGSENHFFISNRGKLTFRTRDIQNQNFFNLCKPISLNE